MALPSELAERMAAIEQAEEATRERREAQRRAERQAPIDRLVRRYVSMLARGEVNTANKTLDELMTYPPALLRENENFLRLEEAHRSSMEHFPDLLDV